MGKREQRKGLVFHHKDTKRAALWITQYDSGWNGQDAVGLYRVRDAYDIPDLHFPVSDIGLPVEILFSSGKAGLYCFLQAFFYDFCKTKKDRAECDKNASDWWFYLLPSGFPDGTIPINTGIVNERKRR